MHSDSCYGGYAAAVTRKADGARRSGGEIRDATESDWPDDDWIRAMVSLGKADSVSIDPHKMGYVPYSAGAILVRDGRTRHLVATEPPYLSPTDNPGQGVEQFLGRCILEGSKPGAAALTSLGSVNAFNERVFGEMSLARKDGAPEYIITAPGSAVRCTTAP